MYNKDKTVIVYLAMNTAKDESYGRDSRSMLEKSLDSLYKHYNNVFKHDIIVFYDSKHPFYESDIEKITNNRKEITFRLIDDSLWRPPECEEIKRKPDPKKWTDPKFSLGYRNMMRWYGILIYKYLSDLGYEMYMRMDDDSILHSDINYDMFQFLHDNNYQYGFRCYCNDHMNVAKYFIEFCKSYIDDNNIKNYWLDRFLSYRFSPKKWTTTQYNILGYYNNFLISKLDFWMRDDVQKFLRALDESGLMYTRRWNDLISQAATIQIFMDRNKIYQFTDWAYEHATFSGNYNTRESLVWGGLYPKISGSEYELDDFALEWHSKYKKYHKNTFQTLNINSCIKIEDEARISGKLYYLSDANTLDQAIEVVNDYYLNCLSEMPVCKQFTLYRHRTFIWANSSLSDENKNKVYIHIDTPIKINKFIAPNAEAISVKRSDAIATKITVIKNPILNPNNRSI